MDKKEFIKHLAKKESECYWEIGEVLALTKEIGASLSTKSQALLESYEEGLRYLELVTRDLRYSLEEG